jgi:hypothetical protein
MRLVSSISHRPAEHAESGAGAVEAPVALRFTLHRTRFDEDYVPPVSTRLTTNYANLARGENRRENLRNAFAMIDARLNDLARWDNPDGDRYSIELDIVSIRLQIDGADDTADFPLIEMLQSNVVDHARGRRITGILGNNLSSYVRDYDFSILLPSRSGGAADAGVPEDFGQLHGHLFQEAIESAAYARESDTPPVICLSVSSTKSYQRTENRHPILGVEYRQDEYSLTDEYFRKMGMQVRYFLPPGGVAPLAFYFRGDLLDDYSTLQLIATVSTMETFQKIYRPEIYNANSAAAAHYRPTLHHADYSTTRIEYDRDERARLAVEQGRFAEEVLIRPHGARLQQWSGLQSTRRSQRQESWS